MVNVVLLGFGKVGKEVVKKLYGDVKFKFLRLSSVFSSGGGVILKDNSDLENLLKLADMGEPLSSHPNFRDISFTEYISENPEGIAIFAIPPSYVTGEPNLSLYRSSIERGYHIVTADKTGLALRYGELINMAKSRGVKIKFTATVAAGTPVLSVARSLRFREINYIRGILNATSNYVLSLIERGKSWDEAINEAIAKGLAEPNPSIDINGVDAAAKLTILLNEMGHNLSMRDVKMVGLRVYNEDEIRNGLKEGLRLKQVVGYDAKGQEAFVRPVFVPVVSPLAFTEGHYNTVEFNLEGESIIVHGPAGPASRTAIVLLSDLLELLDEVRWVKAHVP